MAGFWTRSADATKAGEMRCGASVRIAGPAGTEAVAPTGPADGARPATNRVVPRGWPFVHGAPETGPRSRRVAGDQRQAALGVAQTTAASLACDAIDCRPDRRQPGTMA